MSAPTQLGQAVEIGIGSYTYSGYEVTNVEGPNPVAQKKVLKNKDGETKTKIKSDPGKTLKVTMYALSGSDPTTIDIYDTLTVNGVAYCVEDVKIKRGAGDQEMIVDLDLIKEDSMTYT